MSDETATPGRSCPLHYRYRPEDMAVDAAFRCDTLYVVGGLYGNTAALDEVLRLFAAEPAADKRLVFNGDFHWFDTDPAAFARINVAVLSADATRGNVETEIADPGADTAAGCGCGYPGWVGDGVVERSNRILARLRQTAQEFPEECERLLALPMWLRVDVGGCRVAIVHGDAESLAGWGFAQEHLADPAHRDRVAGWFDRAQVDVFASSHTCLPVLQAWNDSARALVNNGAAGMPNLAGAREGLLTRIARTPYTGAERRFGQRQGAVHIDGLAIRYDEARWQRDFLAQWPSGSDAHASYWPRIEGGSAYAVSQVLRHAPDLR